jgi:dihydroorotase-like cyclic amidohydrolase
VTVEETNRYQPKTPRSTASPRKGTIAIGSDADIALWDPSESVVITNDILRHGADHTP